MPIKTTLGDMGGGYGETGIDTGDLRRTFISCQRLKLLIPLVVLVFLAAYAYGQSVVLSESTTYTAPRIGINTCGSDYYSCYIQKNITSLNAGFEGWQAATAQYVDGSGTTTSFTGGDSCDQVSPNFFAGGTYYIASSGGSGNTGHSGTISANTGPNNGGGGCAGAPVFTISAAPSSIQSGDMIFVYASGTSTNLSTWSYLGWGSNDTGSGTAVVDTTSGDQFPDGGLQNIKLTLTSGSDRAGVYTRFDTSGSAPLYYFNGTYTWCVESKLISGSGAVLTMSGARSSGSTGTFSAVASPAPSGTAAQSCATFTLSESPTNPPTAGALETLYITLSGTGASQVLIDNSVLTNNSDTDLTLWRNQTYSDVVNTLDAGSGRDWIGQNGSSFTNETALPNLRQLAWSAAGAPYPGSGVGPYSVGQSLPEFLTQMYQMGVPRVSYVLPITTTPAEMVEYTDFLAAPCSASTTGSIARCNNWQSTPFTSQFQEIDLSIGNEEWNYSAQGQNWPYGATYPTWTYLPYVNTMCQSMKTDANYNSVLKCSATIQAGQSFEPGYQSQLNTSYVDFQDMNEYGSGGNGANALTDPNTPDQWESAWTDYYIAAFNCTVSGSNFCAGYAQYKTLIYEYQNNTVGTYDGTQTQLNGYANGMGYGLVDTLGPAWLSLGKQAGNFTGMDQYNFFTLYQNATGTSGGLTNYTWGIFVQPGGPNARPRPPAQSVGVYNQCVGALETGLVPSTSGIPTYNFSGYNGVNAQSTIPDIPLAEYKPTSSTRCLAFWNIDPAGASHTLSISGTNAPSGTCTTTTYTSANLNDNNETSLVVQPSTSSGSCPSSITIPKFSMVTLAWSVGSSPQPPINVSGTVKLSGNLSIQ